MTAYDHLTVMSVNLWNLNEPLTDRLRRFSELIDQVRPDVIAMQEVSPLPGSAATLQLRLVPCLADYRLYYNVADASPGRAEGLAIACREPALDAHSYRLPAGAGGADFEPQRVVQYARFRFGSKVIAVFNTHLAYHSSSGPLRVRQASAVTDIVTQVLQDVEHDGVLLCGDLNDTPDSPAVTHLVSKGGFDNPWADLAATKHSYSSRNPYTPADPGVDQWIDYVLTKGLAVHGARLIDEGPTPPVSDHFPVVLQVRLH